MGKGRPRAVEKGVLGHCPSTSSQTLAVPQAPVYYPSESEFQDPLSYISKIRPEAESYGICRIVPPKSWAPPFALDISSFTFNTKSQAIHRLQSRPAACDPATFELEYNRFLENHCGRKPKKRAAVVIFEGEDLSLCYLFNAVKRFGGYDKVVKDKRWGDVFRFVLRSDDKKKRIPKITECAKHVLCQLYREHLYDYEVYCNELNCGGGGGGREKVCKRKSRDRTVGSGSFGFKRRRRKNVVVEVEREADLDNLDQICEQCKSGLHGEVMLLCDRCNKGWHLYCLTPQLEKIPPGNWYCLECLNSDKDSFGFVPGRRLSLDAFRKVAEKAKRKWLGVAGSTGRSVIEKRFWEIVEGSLGKVEVMYGSDLDTSVYGSGFPRENDPLPPSVELEAWKKYCSSPWNLNNLPKLEGSMLQAVHDNIAGVMVPWLYIGMLFSSFCWHFEDHCFYSMNYLHWGEPKCWYSVPGSEAHAFEQVMRKTLPDLFDAQPDLLFQLVTMLNPSVLQEHGVPVYSVLQEPGNFIITFPRSFHGGFNFGLNCAEAVNFAPADWLPHGGFGADLYRFYHKAAVLSHEELLCVLAKGSCSSNVLPYLKEEMFRVFAKEKTSREKLWRNGIIKSSPMSPRREPEYVGTEEDSTCIICQQYLYLSAVVCGCRPSAFVCLEHSEHLCECNPSKHRLLYRHTLAELSDLIHMVTPVSAAPCSLEEATQSRTCLGEISSSNESNALMKKVKGGHTTYKQLAEDWISHSRQIFQNPFADAACISALDEAEQFLWAGHEMDPVRCMASDLIKAQKWAVDVRNCLSKADTWLHHRDGDTGKVDFTDIEDLLCVDPLPCIEPAHPKLKVFMEDARMLRLEIKSALSSCSCVTIADLETLYSRTIDLPILLEESGKLEREISSAKVWVDNVRECISQKKPAAIEVDVLNKLKAEMLQLSVQLPEMDMLSVLLSQIELWQVRCNEFLRGPITLKELDVVLQDADNFTVNIPELKLLRQYHSDALSWIHHFHESLVNIQDREDYNLIVEELTSILEAGESLRVHVDQLPHVKAELRKSRCREKAFKTLTIQMPLEFIQELMKEAALLQITKEKLFMDVSRVLEEASSWEESARHLLCSMGQMSEFEDALRTSESIFAQLPSLQDVKDALSMAESWIRASQPFLMSAVCSGHALNPLLKVDALKELVTQSKLLKVSLKAPEMLHSILKDIEEWELDACSLLEHANSLSNMHDIHVQIHNELSTRIETLLDRVNYVTQAGLSLGFDLYEIPKLQNASSMLRWSLKALSLCSGAPLIKEVDSLIDEAKLLPVTCEGGSLVSSLIDGVKWLRQALMVIIEPRSPKRCKLEDVEEVLEEAQTIKVSFPMMVARLENAIEKHKSWQEQVRLFFNSESGEQSWSLLLQLQELGESDAFDSPELDKVAFEVGKVEKWMMRCKDIVGSSDGDLRSLSGALLKIKDSLDRALCIYRSPKGCREKAFCICCSNDLEHQNAVTCVTCKDWYHLSCMRPSLANAGMAKEYKCPFCLCIETGAISKNGRHPLISRETRPELKMFNELLCDARDFYAGITETDIVQDIVDQALVCKSHLTDIVTRVLAYVSKDLSFMSENLLIVLKAVVVAGVYDDEGSCNLELALARNSWKIRVEKILEGPRKLLIQQIQRILKEGLVMDIPSDDHFMLELTKVKRIGLQWANHAKKVALDSGALELEEVFKLITEGENLPFQFDKELKLLRARSVLYCICRKPHDQRDMIACDQCDEWYHFDCINLREPPPKTFICPACKPQTADILPLSPTMHHDERSSTDDEPQTPPPQFRESKRRKLRKARSSLQQKMQVATDLINVMRCYSETDDLWRKCRRPFRRTARKRREFESLISPLFNEQQ